MRYIRLCLVAALFVAAPSVHAADDILPHQLTLKLDGHTRLNRTIDTDSVLNESGVIHHATSHRDYSEVLTPTATGFTVTRTLTKFAITPATAPDALINTPWWEAKMLDMPKVVLTAAPNLQTAAIDNWPEIEARMIAAFPANGSADDRAAHNALMGAMTPVGAVAVVDGQSSMMAVARKYPLVVGKPVEESFSRQGPMGGGTLDFTNTYTLTRWDVAGDTAEFDFHSAPDNTSLSTYMLDVLLPMVTPAGTPQDQIDAVKADMHLTLDTTCHVVASISSGLVTHGGCTIEVTVHVMSYEQSRKMTSVVSESFAP